MWAQNNAKRWVIMSIIFMLIGIAMIVAGAVIGEMNYYWMIYVGAILFLTFFICFFMFIRQARNLDSMLKGTGLLAHWRFKENERLQRAAEEFLQRKTSNKVMLLVIIAFVVIIGGLFAIFGFGNSKDAIFFIVVLLGIQILISLAAILIPRARYNKMKEAAPEVLISPFGAWIMGEYFQWKAPLTRITSVQFAKDREDNYTITVNFTIWQRFGPQKLQCRIPVPKDTVTEAETIASDIAKINKVRFLNETK